MARSFSVRKAQRIDQGLPGWKAEGACQLHGSDVEEEEVCTGALCGVRLGREGGVFFLFFSFFLRIGRWSRIRFCA